MNRPIQALHVVGAMNRGGVETWLLNVMRRLSRDDVAIDLMVHTDERAAYDDEVEALGATIHRNSHTKELARYGLRLRRILSGSRRYDVVHSHVHHYSGSCSPPRSSREFGSGSRTATTTRGRSIDMARPGAERICDSPSS